MSSRYQFPKRKRVGKRKKEKIKRRSKRRLAGFGVSWKKAEEKIIIIEECVPIRAGFFSLPPTHSSTHYWPK